MSASLVGTAASRLVIEPVADPSGLDRFLAVPYRTHLGDATWVPPLLAMEKRRLTPKRGPFFKIGAAQLFVALRNGEPVGRISAQVNRNHLAQHADNAGHFGFFDCMDDQAAAHGLVEAAADWLRARGSSHMVGPFNFSINEECGLQIDGFDTPPAVFMTQSRPWVSGLLENEGFAKAVDLLAFRTTRAAFGKRMMRLIEKAHLTERISLRAPDMSRREAELTLLVDLFNDSWSGNWGFTPLSPDEVKNLLGGFSRFVRGHFARFVMLDGVPVGVMGFLPNYNEAIHGFGGRLLPFNWAKLLWCVAMDRFTSGRVVILGIRKELHNTPVAGAMVALLVDSAYKETSKRYQWGEMGWVLDTNRPMVRMCEMTAGPPAKRYRLYERAL